MLLVDVVVASEFSNEADHKIVSVDSIPEDMMALDIGSETVNYTKKH